MKITVILPTYNEKNNILLLVDKILKNLFEYKDKEILIIDDNSSDGTFNICRKNLKNNSIKVFLRTKDKGLAKSIRFGIEKSSGDKIIVMDTDHTHDPKYLGMLLKLSEQSDLVVGSRFFEGGKMTATTHHYLSYIFNIFLRILLRTGVKDNLGGYFCINKKSLNNLDFDKIFIGYGEYFLRLIFFLKRKNVKINEVGVTYNLRFKDKSKSNFFKLLFQYTFEALKLRIKNL